jgi:pyruvate kinase
MMADADRRQPMLDSVHPNYRQSARNLSHYLTLRSRDLRPLQRRLAVLGLSSLGRAESHVLATIEAVLVALHRMAHRRWVSDSPPRDPMDFARGQELLADHTERLFGPPCAGRDVRIMVTMPSDAARDYTLVENLLRQGMDAMRINCAHDAAPDWLHMIEHLRRAEDVLRVTRAWLERARPAGRVPIRRGRNRSRHRRRARRDAGSGAWTPSDAGHRRTSAHARNGRLHSARGVRGRQGW